jgi:LPS-assembly lipoprotein
MGGLSLTGCGFRLRGTGEAAKADYQSVYLAGQDKAPPQLVQDLTQYFQAEGVRLVEQADAADILIELVAFERHISRTGFSSTGDTTAELVKLSQAFRVQRRQDARLLLDSRVSVTRDRRLNPSQLLAAARELEEMERQMLQDLVRQLIDRTNRAYLRQPVTQP